MTFAMTIDCKYLINVHSDMIIIYIICDKKPNN